jgi:type IV pilus assembly protein PilX
MIVRNDLRRRERGMVLVTALLLLLVVTILAVSMFRSFGENEKIAGNTREKHRAINAAESAEEYAEWWLLAGNGAAPVACTASNDILAATPTVPAGQVCNAPATPASFTSLPWALGVTYTPQNMPVTGTSGGQGSYYLPPEFNVTFLGSGGPPNNPWVMYQIDAVGYAGSPDTAAVVETVYKIGPTVPCITQC